ncbi:CC0125/CC1285 family lipoprotein [Hyphococcus sp.]|uniref:CC0125/CC1285 family lipoprotein n=1 Tax=Hyphococcus sp. TaxID=2038636 RepID=UPI003CCBFB51
MKTKVMIAAFALATAGCATGYYGPVYEPANSQYDDGYSEARLDDNRYRVQYRVDNGDLQLAQDWAFRRAAELTLNQRYDWFQIINRNRMFRDDAFDRYESFRTYNDRYNERPRYYDSRYDDDAVAVIEIVMGNNPPPRSASVYDARNALDYTRRSSRY